jgi:hypothetical protein
MVLAGGGDQPNIGNDSMIHPSQERRATPSMRGKVRAVRIPTPSFSMAALAYLAMAIAVLALGILAASL